MKGVGETQIVDNLIILGLIVGSFVFGLKLAGHYYQRFEKERDYQERLREARELAHWKGPGGPYVSRQPISTGFMDKLKTEGRAVQKLEKVEKP